MNTVLPADERRAAEPSAAELPTDVHAPHGPPPAARADGGAPTDTLRTTARVNAVAPSGIRRFFDIAATMPEVISLGIGEPDFVTPEPILRAGIASLEAGHTGYTSNSGLIELRVALAAHLERRYGVRYDPETEILITVGGSEALHLVAQALVEPLDEVLVPEPCFVAYPAVVTLAGGTPVPVVTRAGNGFQLDVADLRARTTARTRGLLIGYPSNPTGAVMDRPQLEAVAAFAAERDLYVISDEIYDQLVYGQDHTCFAALPGMRERTALLGGFSKSYAMTGWRIGYACAPAPLVAALRKVHQYIIMSAPTAGQYAALAALTDPAAAAAVVTMAEAYDTRRRLVVDGFNAIGLPTFEPRGAFYAFPDVRPTGLDSNTFCERLLYEHKVAMVPGEAFGEAGRGYARCSYATSVERLTEALARVGAFVAAL